MGCDRKIERSLLCEVMKYAKIYNCCSHTVELLTLSLFTVQSFVILISYKYQILLTNLITHIFRDRPSMEITDPALQSLAFALSNQARNEVIEILSSIEGGLKMEAARLVMKFVVVPSELTVQAEFCVSFVESLLSFMISFLSDLILERVETVRASPKYQKELSRRFERKSMHSSMHVSSEIGELEECGHHLSLLRKLESDMQRLQDINAGILLPETVLTRTGSVNVSTFPDVTSMESVTEKCLLLSNPCTGMYWLSQRIERFSSKQMRATACLIAYLFITSPSLDSFFVGIHILRNSGHHVEDVLRLFYRETAVKFVRDRIASHLAHRGFEANKNLMILEELYPNNCYWTELNRAWSRVGTTNPSQGRLSENAFISVPCGNVPDIAERLEKPSSGQIGSVSQEESLSVLKCADCLDSKQHLVSEDSTTTTLARRGYLYVTSAWIERMTGDEIAKICMEAGGLEIDLEYAVFHKDWRSILTFDFTEQYMHLSTFDHGSFLNRILRETAYSQGLGGQPGRAELARIRRLLTDGMENANVEFHSEILKWFLSASNDYPQLALLYLRRFELGNSEEAVDELCRIVPEIEFLAKGRLGHIVQPAVTPMEHLAVWMTTHDLAEPVALVSDLLVAQPDEILISNISTMDVFDVKSFKADISLRELLQDFFPELDLFVLGKSLPVGSGMPSDIDLLEYHVAQGRPCLAHARIGDRPMDSNTLQKAARRVAMYNLFDDGIVASAIALLELFGEPTEILRVDVHCARTIGQGREVRDLFLNFDKGQTQLLSALKLLEESAWAKEPPIGADQAPAPGGFESPWHLVALFCRVHNLPRSLTLLHELARNGDWVMFLHESDLQQCPVETVQDVVQLYFESSSPLRSHLNILLDVHSLGSPRTASQDKRALVAENDHETQLHKALALFKFDRARTHYLALSERDRTCIERYKEGPLSREIRRITETKIERTARKPTLVVEEDDVKSIVITTPTSVSSSPGVAEKRRVLSTESLKKALKTRDFESMAGMVDSEESTALLTALVQETLQADAEWKDEEMESMLDILAPSMLEKFADELQSVTTKSRKQRQRIDRITYFAYARAFVSAEKFEAFIQRAKLTCSSDEPTKSEPSIKIPVAPQLIEQVSIGKIDSPFELDAITLLGATIRLSRLYASMSLLKKHMDANRSAEMLLEEIRGERQIT